MKKKKLNKAVKAALRVLKKGEDIYGEVVTTKSSEGFLYIEIKLQTDDKATFI